MAVEICDDGSASAVVLRDGLDDVRADRDQKREQLIDGVDCEPEPDTIRHALARKRRHNSQHEPMKHRDVFGSRPAVRVISSPSSL
jgi:hypothetical protein